MAGILDSKTRIIDFTLTETGKEQLRDGKLQAEFASYTDLHTFYEGTDGVADDASGRLILEAFRRVQDKITPEALLDGRMLNFQQGDLKLFDAGILSGTAGQIFDPVQTTAAFNRFLSGSVDNFSQNRILSEWDEFETGIGFTLSKTSVSLPQLQNRPFIGDSPYSINSIPPIQLDKRFAGVSNYFYRPPEGLLPSEDESSLNRAELRDFLFPDPRPFGSAYETPASRLEEAKVLRFNAMAYGMADIEIRTEENDDVMIQCYLQMNGNEITKYIAVPIAAEPDRSAEYYLFGKILTDDDGTNRFVDAFLLVIRR